FRRLGPAQGRVRRGGPAARARRNDERTLRRRGAQRQGPYLRLEVRGQRAIAPCGHLRHDRGDQQQYHGGRERDDGRRLLPPLEFDLDRTGVREGRRRWQVQLHLYGGLAQAQGTLLLDHAANSKGSGVLENTRSIALVSRSRRVARNSPAPCMASNALRPRSRNSCRVPKPAACAGPRASRTRAPIIGLRTTWSR